MNTNIKEVKHSLAKKLLVSFLVICTLAGLLLSELYYRHAKQDFWKAFSDITTSCALNGAKILYDAPIDDFLNGREQEKYDYYRYLLKDLTFSFNLRYLYVYVPDLENDQLIAVLGIDGKTGGEIENYNRGEPLKDIRLNPQVVNMYLTGQKRLTLEMNNNFGHVFTGYSTVFDKSGNPIAVVGADYDFKYLLIKLIKDCSLIFVLIFAVLLFLYLSGIFYILKIFVNPIVKLSTELTSYLRKDIYEHTPISLNTNDEINVLADLCNGIAYEKKRIESELNIAKKIQLSSLQRVFPPFPNSKEFDVYANIKTAKEVGGDFYDFFYVDTNSFVFLIADVCGKGIPAALFMMKVKSLLKSNLQTGMELDEAITKVNLQICESNKENYFVTAFIARINLNTGDISFVNAGHNYPLIKTAGGDFEFYKSHCNVVLGVFDECKYQKTDAKLNANDEIFLYTDGVTEAMDVNDKLYGEERLKTVLNASKNFKIEDIIGAVEKDVDKFSENTEQSDDITTLIFKYNGPSV